ncbi:MAG: hypothetical protein IJ225_00895 [Solobacterium sp.]|nr:hypothetical protein [Solobacterium sp.]
MNWLLIANLLYVYLTAAILILVFSVGSYSDILTSFLLENPQVPFLLLILLAVVILIGTVIFAIRLRKKILTKEEIYTLAGSYRTMKLLQIPAYLIIFATGVLCLLTIFTFGISVILLIIDGIGVALSGIYALAVLQKLRERELITTTRQIVLGVMSFVFCLDVIAAVIAGSTRTRK